MPLDDYLYDTIQTTKGELKIYYDNSAENPRDWDNFGHIICWHRRYDLGDKHNYRDKDEFLYDLLEDTVGDTDKAERIIEKIQDKYYGERDYERKVDNDILDIIKTKHVILPLYLYDHSGITMSTSPFGDPWDSGQVGWIYASYEDIKKEFNVKHVTQNIRQKAISVLEAEVELYDKWLQGEVFGYILDGDNTDSCWGFFGDDFEENGLYEEALGPDWRQEILNEEMIMHG